jgi:hypothetical protein
MSGGLRVIAVRGGWTVRDDDGYVDIDPWRTKRAALARLAEVTEIRAWLRDQEAADEARALAWLAARGLAPVDYRDLQPGDTYAYGLYRPVKAVVMADHFDSGASMIWHELPTGYARPGAGMPFYLLVPSMRAYGILRRP